MQSTFRMRTWEAACITASALVASSVVGIAVYRNAGVIADRAKHMERVAAAFENPVCAEFVHRPVTALPRIVDRQQVECSLVVWVRSNAHERGESTQLSSADVRAWPMPERVTLGQVLTGIAVFGGPLLAFLYGCGLAASLVVRWIPVIGRPFQSLLNVVRPGWARRAAAFVLYVVLFLGVLGLGIHVVVVLQGIR